MPTYPLLHEFEKMDVLHESFIVVNSDVDIDRSHVVINGKPIILIRGKK